MVRGVFRNSWLKGVACFIDEHGEIADDLLSHFGGSIGDAQKAIEKRLFWLLCLTG
ncbi:hypothetical protein FX988_01332 [Paraglaciecola mesophila]|uniref:Uncharacterized protein n=1 Tax=Paraglaciecola mesophila TaxID=197222 RepID=A0A857JIX4_9ALTE|nr:hypothetical protein [Paraglaciecola mesophila]QHJ11110.1 hypothetical protein FX988_01332 [Paraglaciecola mesophila]